MQIVVQRPPGRHHPVPFGGDVVHFQHQFHAGWRPPGGPCVRHRRQDRADLHRAAAQCDIVLLARRSSVSWKPRMRW